MPDRCGVRGWPPWAILLVLIIAGEAAFALPFHVARFFRPTLLNVLGIDQAELGWMQSAYGVSAFVSYAPGGWLADRVGGRALITLSLLLTALGGVYFWTLPSRLGLLVLHVYWGVTTILFLWGALMRATRDDAPEERQGKAFGILDGGRGLLAALVAGGGLLLLGNETLPTGSIRQDRLKDLIAWYTLITALVGALCWWGLRGLPPPKFARTETCTPREQAGDPGAIPQRAPNADAHKATVDWASWERHLLHGAVIVAAYCAYKGLDFCSTYATEVFGQSEVQGATWASSSIWMRPVCALLFGLAGDRSSARRLTVLSFVGLVLVYCLSALLTWSGQTQGAAGLALLGGHIVGTSVFAFGLRALYFALLAETGVERASTGTAVGVVSVLGYTPDFFFPAWAGSILESYPDPTEGYAVLFLVLAGFSLLGLCAAGGLGRRGVSRSQNQTHPT